jgi:hypothetical protein
VKGRLSWRPLSVEALLSNVARSVVCCYGPLDAGPFRGPVGPISIGSGLFSKPTAIRDLPDVVIRSLPCRFTMYPSSINRARCWAGMTGGGSRIAHVLPTVRREANSSGVRGSDSRAIMRLCTLACIGTWSNLLRWANKPDLVEGWPNSRNSCSELGRESKWRIGSSRARLSLILASRLSGLLMRHERN